MTAPGGERLTFVIDSTGAPQVVGDLQRIGSAGVDSQTRVQQRAKETEGALTAQGRAGDSAMQVIASGAEKSTGLLGRMSDRLGVNEQLLRTGIATGAAVGFGILVSKVGDAVNSYVDLAGEVRNFQRVSGESAETSSRFVAVLDDLQINSSTAATALTRLARVDPSKLEQFGVEIARSSDGAVSLTETLLNVADAYAATSDPQQRALLGNAAFGRSYQSLIPLLEQGRSGLQSYFDGVNAGQIYTQEALDQTRQYERALDNFQDALAEAGQAAGRTLVPALTNILNIGADFLGFIDSIPGPLVSAALSATAFGIAGAKISGALAGIRTARAAEAASAVAGSVGALGNAAEVAEGKTSRFGRALGGLNKAGAAGAALGAAIPLLSQLADYIRSLAVEDVDVDRLTTSLEALAATGSSGGVLADTGGIEGFGQAVREALDVQDASTGFLGQVTALGTAPGFSQATENVKAYDEALAQMVESGNADGAAAIWEQLTASAAAQGVSVEQLKSLFPGYAAAVEDAGLKTETAAAQGDEMATSTTKISDAAALASDQLDRLKTMIDMLRDGQISLAEADIAARDSVADFTDQVQNNIETLGNAALSLDRTTQAGRDNESALIDQIKAAQDLANATLEQTGSTKQAQKAFETQIGSIRDNAIQLGFNRDAVNALIGRYAAVPSQVRTAVNADDQASGKILSIKALMKSLDGTVSKVTVKQIYQSEGVAAKTGKAIGGAVSPASDYMVGEVRPEIFRPQVAGTIVPTGSIAQPAAGGGALMNVEQLNVRTDRDIDQIAALLAWSGRK